MTAPRPTPAGTPRPHRIVVLSKAPIKGFVKTRLASVIGPDASLAVHRRLTSHVLAEVEMAVDLATLSGGIDAEIRVTPDEEAPGARTWVPSSIRIRPQGSGDLGDRMRRAFDEGFAEGAKFVLVVGTDCPGFTRRDPADAFAALSRADVVLGPAADGGFWLLGARGPTPELFHDVPWSTSAVLEATKSLARAAGRTVEFLETLADIDTVDDLDRLRRDPRGHDLRL